MGAVSMIVFAAFVLSLLGMFATTIRWTRPISGTIGCASDFVWGCYMVDWMFGGYNAFVYDPNPTNWRRKTNS